MRSATAGWFLMLAMTACGTEPDDTVVWGSSQASLTITEGRATVRILASGGCYGSYGQIDQPIPSGSFTLSGTYTQLMGVYPGSVQYAAEFSGTLAGPHLSLAISVPALQQTLGPFNLSAGVATAWSACLYP